MLDGIEALSQNNVYTCSNWLNNIVLVSLIIYIICICVLYFSREDMKLYFAILSLFTFVCFSFFLICSCTNKSKLDYIEYKVTISDEVSMTKFNDRYEILDQEGKIYTIKEKMVDNNK